MATDLSHLPRIDAKKHKYEKTVKDVTPEHLHTISLMGIYWYKYRIE